MSFSMQCKKLFVIKNTTIDDMIVKVQVLDPNFTSPFLYIGCKINVLSVNNLTSC